MSSPPISGAPVTIMSSPRLRTGTNSAPGNSRSGPISPGRTAGSCRRILRGFVASPERLAAGVVAGPAEERLPVLPAAPTDAEKLKYSDRNLALIMRASLFSFGSLLISQTRFLLTAKPLLIFAPVLTFTVIYYLISLYVNFGTHGFDMAAHDDLVGSWQPRSYPSLDVFLDRKSGV